MGRGRPKGSKNKPKIVGAVVGVSVVGSDTAAPTRNIKDLKREIRSIKKLKLQCRAGTKERIELHRQMTELKHKLIELKKVQPVAPIPTAEQKQYKKNIIYTGWMSESAKQRMRDNYSINFVRESIGF